MRSARDPNDNETSQVCRRRVAPTQPIGACRFLKSGETVVKAHPARHYRADCDQPAAGSPAAVTDVC